MKEHLNKLLAFVLPAGFVFDIHPEISIRKINISFLGADGLFVENYDLHKIFYLI